jgi:hypothetical protein
VRQAGRQPGGRRLEQGQSALPGLGSRWPCPCPATAAAARGPRTLPTALAAPVEEGMMLPLTERPPRQSFLEGPSTVFWVAVAACTVVISPSAMPKFWCTICGVVEGVGVSVWVWVWAWVWAWEWCGCERMQGCGW